MPVIENLVSEERIPFDGMDCREALITTAILNDPDHAYGVADLLSAEVRQRFADNIMQGRVTGTLSLYDWSVTPEPSTTAPSAHA